MCSWGSSDSDEFRNCFSEAFDDWAMSERRLQKISFLLGSSLQPLPVGLIYIISWTKANEIYCQVFGGDWWVRRIRRIWQKYLTLLSRTHLQTHWIGSSACSVNTICFKRRLHVKWEKQLKLIVSHLHNEIARMITEAFLEKMRYLLRPLFVWLHSAQYWGSNTWKNLGSTVQEWESHMLSGCYASHFLFPFSSCFFWGLHQKYQICQVAFLFSSHMPISTWNSCWST